MPNKSVIAVVNFYAADQAIAQIAGIVADVCASIQKPITGEHLKEIALRHNTIVGGFQFADKFDFDAIAAELNSKP